MNNPASIIKEFCVTEKATDLASTLNKYTFEVFKETNRSEVKKAIESTFNVKVTQVNILNKTGKKKRSSTQRGRYGFTASKKRVIVTLKEGDKIEII